MSNFSLEKLLTAHPYIMIVSTIVIGYLVGDRLYTLTHK